MAIYSIVVVFWFLLIYLTFLWIKIGWNNLRANKNRMSCFIDFESLSSDYVLFTLLLPYLPFVCCLRFSASLSLILFFQLSCYLSFSCLSSHMIFRVFEIWVNFLFCFSLMNFIVSLLGKCPRNLSAVLVKYRDLSYIELWLPKAEMSSNKFKLIFPKQLFSKSNKFF